MLWPSKRKDHYENNRGNNHEAGNNYTEEGGFLKGHLVTGW